jgi:hypothetical protein
MRGQAHAPGAAADQDDAEAAADRREHRPGARGHARAQTSAHPDREGLARLQALAEGPLSRGAAARRARAKRTGRRRNR